MTNGNLGDLFWRLGVKSTLDSDISTAEGRVDGFGKTAEASETATRSLADSMKIAGAVATGLGASIVALTDKSKKTNAALGVTALQLGVSKEEMRDLALATTNVTFPLDQVQQSFDLLTRAGMKNKEQIAATATAFDTLGDSIDKPAAEVTKALIPAFNAFDIPLENAAENTDALTHLFRNTTIDLQDFSSAMNYLAPDLETLDIGLGDTAAVLEAMAAKGVQGSAATREFRKAVTAADGDVNALYEALGLTAAEVATYRDQIESADGMTKEFAAAANEQYGMVDNLRQKWDEWSLSLGSALEPLDSVGGVLTAVGPIMMSVSMIQTSTVVPSLMATATAGWAAMAPFLPFVVAIGAVIAIGYLLETRFGVITMTIGYLGEKALWLLGPVGLVIMAFQHWEEIPGIIAGIFDTVMALIEGLGSWFRDAGMNLIGMLVDGILHAPISPIGALTTVLGGVADLLPHSPAKVGPLAFEPNWDSYLVDPLAKSRAGVERAATEAIRPAALAIRTGTVAAGTTAAAGYMRPIQVNVILDRKKVGEALVDYTRMKEGLRS